MFTSLPTAILFDWDGTLVDSMARVHASLNHSAVLVGLPAVTHEQTHESTIYGAEAVQKVFGLEGKTGETFWNHFCAHYFESEDHCTLAAGVEGLMAALPPSIPLGIVTNGRRDMIDRQIKQLSWQSRFSAVVCADEAPRNKPHPDPALMALDLMGITPSRDVWFIGDTRGDVECAQGAGLTSILLTSSTPLCAPHFHFADCAEIHSHFVKLAA